MAKGSGEPPRPPAPSALTHHQLLFGFLGVISPKGRRAIARLSLSLIQDTPPMLLVHICTYGSVYVCAEGWQIWIIAQGRDCKAISESVHESQQANIDEVSMGNLA